jgi:hypothetical protein
VTILVKIELLYFYIHDEIIKIKMKVVLIASLLGLFLLQQISASSNDKIKSRSYEIEMDLKVWQSKFAVFEEELSKR